MRYQNWIEKRTKKHTTSKNNPMKLQTRQEIVDGVKGKIRYEIMNDSGNINMLGGRFHIFLSVHEAKELYKLLSDKFEEEESMRFLPNYNCENCGHIGLIKTITSTKRVIEKEAIQIGMKVDDICFDYDGNHFPCRCTKCRKKFNENLRNWLPDKN